MGFIQRYSFQALSDGVDSEPEALQHLVPYQWDWRSEHGSIESSTFDFPLGHISLTLRYALCGEDLNSPIPDGGQAQLLYFRAGQAHKR